MCCCFIFFSPDYLKSKHTLSSHHCMESDADASVPSNYICSAQTLRVGQNIGPWCKILTLDQLVECRVMKGPPRAQWLNWRGIPKIPITSSIYYIARASLVGCLVNIIYHGCRHTVVLHGFGKNPQSSEWLVGPYVHAREGLLCAIVSPHLPFKCRQMASLQYHRVPSCVCVIVWGIYCSVMLGKGCVHMYSTPSRNVASLSPPSIECASPYTWMIITQRYRTKSKQPS